MRFAVEHDYVKDVERVKDLYDAQVIKVKNEEYVKDLLFEDLADKIPDDVIAKMYCNQINENTIKEYVVVYRDNDIYKIIDKIYSEESAYTVLTMVIKAGYNDSRIEVL